MIAKALEDTAHDTVLTRVNLNAYLLLVGWRCILDSISFDITVIEGDTVKNLTHIISCNRLVEVNMIYLLLQELRVSKLRSKVTIVSEKQYTCCVTVKTTYRIDTLWTCILNEIHNNLTLLRIVGSCNIVLWLVEEHVNLLLESYRLIVEHDGICAEYLCSELCYYLSVYGYYSCLDEVISLTT